MLVEEVPKLMSMIPREEEAYVQSQSSISGTMVTSKAKKLVDDENTPFSIGSVEGINAGIYEHDWIVNRTRIEADEIFAQLSPQNGKISGASAKQEMIKSKLVKEQQVSFSIQRIFSLLQFLAQHCSCSYMEVE